MEDTSTLQGPSAPAASTELSPHEWEAQLGSELGGDAQPTGGDNPSQASPPPNGNPLIRWAKNIARGPGDAVNALARTGAETAVRIKQSPLAMKLIGSIPGIGEGVAGGINAISGAVGDSPDKAKQVSPITEEELSAVYGPRPTDFIGSTLHGISQFVTGALAFGPLGSGTAGAVSMGAAFDPYEASASDLAVKYGDKVPVVGHILANAGKVLQVNPKTDGPIEARFKKAVEGEIVGRLTGIIFRPLIKAAGWGYQRVAAVKAGDEAAAAHAAEQLTHVNDPEPGDAVQVVAAGNGRYEVAPVQELRQPVSTNGGRPSTAANNFQDALDQYFGNQPGEERILRDAQGNPLVRAALSSKGGDVVELKTLENLSPANRSGNPTQVMQEITRLADEHGVTLTLQASPFGEKALSREALRDFYRKFGFEQTKGDANMVRRPGDVPTDFRETAPVSGNGNGQAPRVTYSDPAAALSDAATINGLAHENARASVMFTPDEVATHQATADQLLKGDSESLEANPHFNLQSIGGGNDFNAQVSALTQNYGKLFEAAQSRPGVTIEELHKQAARVAGEMQLDNFEAAMAQARSHSIRTRLALETVLRNAAMKQAGREMAEVGSLMRAKPGDDALLLLARKRLATFLTVADKTAEWNTELGRGLRFLQERDAPSAEAIQFGSPTVADAQAEAIAPGITDKLPELDPAKMPRWKLEAYARLFERSGGDIRLVPHILKSIRQSIAERQADFAAKSTPGKFVDRLVTTFINSVISGYKTAATIATSGATMNAFQASAKILAGAGTLNRGLAEEGAAQAYALFRYAKENMRGAWAALKEGRSVIDGTPPFHVDPNPIMKGIAVPGRVAGALDEFTRVSAYRADEFSRAFRAARNDGLSLADAAKRAELDVRVSVDQATGMGLNPAALKRAGIPTLSDNLGNDTFMGKLSNTLGEYPLTKFAVPFIRPSVNTFRFSWANAPLLNRFSRDAQAALLEGGEAATTLHAQATMTGSMMLYAMSKYMDGEITGAGPKDPALRNEWSKNHQPYSVRLGGQWHSYRRMEPFATFLGAVADGFEVYHEIPEEDRDTLEEKVQGAMSAVFSAATRNVTSKSWTQSLLDFFSALDDKDQQAATRYLRGTVSGLVPFSAAIRQFNTDPSWREARTILDGVRAEIPGWSETLPARYDWSGEKRAKQGSLWNRNFAIAPTLDAKPLLEDALVDNYIRLSPPNPRPYPGIDMWDQKWANQKGVTPYERWMELLAKSGVRSQVQDMVNGEAFQQAPKGTAAYPNSLRGQLVSGVVGSAQEAALQQMLTEYPSFATAYNTARYVIPSIGKAQGQEAADSLKGLYGISTNTRR